jgi:hypothetical protein
MASRTREISCSPKDTLVICSMAAIEVLISAGYQAVRSPIAATTSGRCPAPPIISACGNSQAIAEDLVGCGVCQDWQVSLSDLSCHRDFTEVVERCGIEIVHRIIGQSEPFHYDYWNW